MTQQTTAPTRPVWTSDNCPLSRRRLEVLREVALRNSLAKAGRHLSISESTVKTHLFKIRRALGCTSTAQAVATARRAGWI